MRKRRREEEREPEQSQLARLDATTRTGVLEQLQRASGNRALQDVVAGPRLQRDTTTTTAKPGTASTHKATAVLSVGGTVVGSVGSVEGGSIRSEVIEEPVGYGDVVRKRIGSVEHEPFVLKVGLGLGKGFYEWIAATVGRRILSKALTIHEVEPDSGLETGRLELEGCLVTSMKLPQLGPAEKGSAWLEVTIAPEAVKRHTGSGTKVGTKTPPDALDPSTARLEISGIGRVSGLASIAPWTFGRGVKRPGEHGHQEPTKADLGNLLVTLADGAKGGATSFDAWVEKSMIEGERDDERTAVLSVSSTSGRRLELSFSGVGIFSAEQIARAGAGGRRYGMFVQGVTFRVA